MQYETMGIKALVADDDPAVHEALKAVFAGNRLQMLSAYDGEQALQLLQSSKPDILVTDIMMPKMNGLELLRTVRENSDIPVIILSAKKEEIYRLTGLQLGADDYITKPFSAKEVALRIHIVLRRLRPKQPRDIHSVVIIDNLEINIKAYTIKLNGKPVPCTRKEIQIMWTLATHEGIAFSRDELIRTVWSGDKHVVKRAVDVQIKNIRSKLCRNGNGWEIRHVWGVGYRLERLKK